MKLNNNNLHVGNNIDLLLKEKKVKKTEFAKLLGISREYSYALLNKEVQNTDILQKLHEKYNIAYDLFFENLEDLKIKIKGNNNIVMPLNGSNDKEIEILISEVSNLKKEKEYLKELIKTKDELIQLLKKQ